jgi:hypothetical protein
MILPHSDTTTLHVFNVLSTFKHYFTQNMMFSSVNTYNFHSNIGKSTVSTMSNGVYDTHRDNGVNPKLLSGHVLTIFRSSWGMGGHLVFTWAKSYGCLFYACFRHYFKKTEREI